MHRILISVTAALGSALGYGASSVLQQRESEEQPDTEALKPGLLLRLARRPLWLAGLGAGGIAYLLQFVALRHGSLTVVQPLLVSGLLFALPIGAVLNHCRIERRDLVAGGLIVAGLSAFLIASRPANGRPDATPTGWILLGVATFVLMGALIAYAVRSDAVHRAASLGAAAGIANGIVAALTKSSAHLLRHGLVPLLTHWQPYALVAAGAASLTLAQSAFQAGSLAASLPMLTVVDPVASTLIGALLFGESLTITGAAPLLEIGGVAAIVAGVFVLGRSSLVTCTRKRAPAAIDAGVQKS